MNNYLISKLGSHYTKVLKALLFILYLQENVFELSEKIQIKQKLF